MKKKICYVCIIISLIIGFFLGCWIMYNYMYSNSILLDVLLNFSIVDIIEIVVEISIGYFVYKYTKKDTREEKINNKRIELLEKIYKPFEQKIKNITNISRNEFKLIIQEIQNASTALVELCENTKYEENVKNIDNEIANLEEYITKEIEDIPMKKLLDTDFRKEKIEKYIKSITSKCNNTIVNIYKE